MQDTAFCVYRGALAHYSEVFHTPPPAGRDQVITMVGDNRVPVIELEDDPRHFGLLFELILPLGPNPLSPLDMPLVFVDPLVHLTSKYCTDTLSQRIWSGLDARLPKSANTLKKLAVYSSPSEALSIIRASRNEPRLVQCVPFAYYVLATVDWNPESWGNSQITPEERNRRDLGRTKLLESFGTTSFQLSRGGRCRDCDVSVISLWNDGERKWRNLMLHPLETIEVLLSSSLELGFCGKNHPDPSSMCIGKFKWRLESMRQTILENLPGYFDLSPGS